MTAGFCAVAGVYAAVRPGSDTASAAAGTSIGISLVPPLCVSGYGIGIGVMMISKGSLLLFLANMVAIVAVGTIAFVAMGFGRVDVHALEKAEVADPSTDTGVGVVADPAARRLIALFDTRFGSILRLGMPLVFLGIVYLPLRQALDKVVWQARARSVVAAELEQTPQLIDSRTRIEPGLIQATLVITGTERSAEAAKTRMSDAIAAKTGVAPTIEVVALPTAQAFSGLETSLHMRTVAPASAPAPVPLDQLLVDATTKLAATISAHFPSSPDQLLLGIAPRIATTPTGSATMTVDLYHLGDPLPVSTLNAMELGLKSVLPGIGLRAQPLPRRPLVTPSSPSTEELATFESAALIAMERARGLAGVVACLTVPKSSSALARRASPGLRQLQTMPTDAVVATRHIEIEESDHWELRFAERSCAASDAISTASSPR